MKKKVSMLSKQKSVTLVQRAFRSKKVVSTEPIKKQSWPGRTTLLTNQLKT